jgi:hypothetical protein
MNFLKILIKPISVFFSFLLIFLSCFEVTEPVLNPDYTGQTDTIFDIEGNAYKTIGIGSQIWMAENLKTTTLNNNSPIPGILNDCVWGHLYSPGYCWYKNE